MQIQFIIPSTLTLDEEDKDTTKYTCMKVIHHRVSFCEMNTKETVKALVIIQWQKVFASSQFLWILYISATVASPKTAWNQSYCMYHLWSNKHACRMSAALCIDWIRTKISQCDQGRDRVRLKDLRLHLPMNIWCLSEARASDPLSGRRGVGGNLPYLHLATFQQFLMRMCRHIPVVSYAAAVCIKWKLSFSS